MSQVYDDAAPNKNNSWEDDLEAILGNFAALKSSFSGADDPPDPIPGLKRLNTTLHLLGIRNEDNDDYLEIWDMEDNVPILDNVTEDHFPAAVKDAAPAVASLRSLGTGAQQAAPGDDERFSQVVDGAVLGGSLAAPVSAAKNITNIDASGNVTVASHGYQHGDSVIIGNTDTNRDGIHVIEYVDANTFKIGGDGTSIVGKAINITPYRGAKVFPMTTERTTQSATYIPIKEIEIKRTGTVTIIFALKKYNNNTAYGRVYVNDVEIGTQRSSITTEYRYYAEDIAVEDGDFIELYYRHSTGNNVNNQSIIKDFYVVYQDALEACITMN